MTSRIFVGYDGTGASIAAVKWAVDEARLRQARLHIVTCYDIPPTGDAAYGSAPREDFEESFLAARRAAHEMQEAIEFEEPGVEVAVQITAGSPAMELLAEAATRDLIVIGASRHHRTQAILFGSTGRQLARHQTCPLVVVRVAGGEGPSRRVVAGVDGSGGALPAVRWAADEAERRHVDLRLLHVWEPHDVSREKADAMLEAAQVSVGKREAVSVRTDVVERSAQLRFADILAPDELLVIGSHARGRLKSALFGSTVNNLIEQSPATVVIVPRHRSE
jgi:nucleotide-binding universal stress UspA family protein